MPAALEEYQFELEDVVFGLDGSMSTVEGSFSPGRPELRTKDTVIEGGDGARPGRDHYGVSTWAWKLFADGQSSAEALQFLAELQAVWPTEEIRLQPNAVVPLRYNLGERTRRVYGRPRRFESTPTNGLISGTIGVACDFSVFDYRYYDDVEQGATVDISPTVRDSGVLVPFIPPFTSRRRAGPRTTSIQVGGDVPTPVVVVFEGPVLGPRVKVSGKLKPTPQYPDGEPWNGWVAEIPSLVASNDPVTIDARPWARTVTKKSGGGVRTSPRVTRIQSMLLPPGQHDIAFTGEDATGESSVTVKWRDAYRSL